MRVLIADEFSSAHKTRLESLGLSVDVRPGLKGPALVEAAASANILVVRSTEVPRAVFEHAPSLSLVVRAGAGVNTIDVTAASLRGVYVANCPGQNAIAVAELAVGLMLAFDRKIPDNVSELRAGRWEKKRFSAARGLHGRVLGIAGVGAIGTAVASRARALGMRVVGFGRNFTPARAQALGLEHAQSLLSLASAVDVLSVHLPLTQETRGIVSPAVLAAMKTGALFINTARAEVVDQAALLAEAKSGRLWVATDVFEGEPTSGSAAFSSELASLPNVYGTHHIGASTEQAQAAIADEAVRIVESFVTAGEVPNCVNVARRTPARHQLIVRHIDTVGVLANVLGELKEAGINVQEVSNTVFTGAQAACAKIQLDVAPSDEVLRKIRARSHEVIFVDLVALRS